MAHYEPPHQDICCLQNELFLSLVFIELILFGCQMKTSKDVRMLQTVIFFGLFSSPVSEKLASANNSFHAFGSLVDSTSTRDKSGGICKQHRSLMRWLLNEPPHLDLHCLPSSL